MRTHTKTEAASDRRHSARRRWMALAPVLVLMGCSGSAAAPPQKPGGPAPIVDVERFLPLTNDTVFAYETESESTGDKGVLMLSVKRPRPGRAELMVGGKVQRLDLARDGIRHATGGYLLKAPLSLGARWKGLFGEVRVTAMDRAIEVPAGRFQGCVETIEEVTAPAAKRATTVFCPDVGIVLLQAEGTSDGDYAIERARLRSHGPRVDINNLPSP